MVRKSQDVKKTKCFWTPTNQKIRFLPWSNSVSKIKSRGLQWFQLASREPILTWGEKETDQAQQAVNKRGNVTTSRNLGYGYSYLKLTRRKEPRNILSFEGIVFVNKPQTWLPKPMIDNHSNLRGANPTPAGSALWQLCRRKRSHREDWTRKNLPENKALRVPWGMPGKEFTSREQNQGQPEELSEELLHYMAGNHYNSCLEEFGNSYGPMIAI